MPDLDGTERPSLHTARTASFVFETAEFYEAPLEALIYTAPREAQG
jgi:hypothetical protein